MERHLTLSQKCRENVGAYMQCYECPEKFHNLAALKYHLQNHASKSYCSKKMPFLSSKANTDGNNELKNNSKSCAEIHGLHDKTVGIAVDQEAISETPETTTFCCGDCGKGYPTTFQLNQHSIKHCYTVHSTKSLMAPGRMTGTMSLSGNKSQSHLYFQCSLCKEEFFTIRLMTKHLRFHAFGTYGCNICKLMFTRKTLNQHQKVFHPENTGSNHLHTNRQCYICKKTVAQTNLTQHLEDHKIEAETGKICNVQFNEISLVKNQKLFQLQVLNGDRKKQLNKLRQIKRLSKRAFRKNDNLQHHLMKTRFNKGVSENLMDIEIEATSVQASNTFSYECYVCKKHFRTFGDLHDHMQKHFIFERWTDPANVYLSNWSPAKSQEILQNEPLVLVENLKSLNDFYHRNDHPCQQLSNVENLLATRIVDFTEKGKRNENDSSEILESDNDDDDVVFTSEISNIK
ncbi:zinc finger protein 557-like isoform X2 [Bradysia coprophila]|uniref:zinc finger protein 557-like isoform X2 n=1 Tax=Bradysia coprophila TaxID=38358 RepID=UPI00187D9BB9|nr:zinc finger protein 557-like isoform X2 [Bradysia coprophila]